MSIAAPKHIIVNLILSSIPEIEISKHFSIVSTNIRERLQNQQKRALINFLHQYPDIFNRLEGHYPLNSIHSFFLPKIDIETVYTRLEYITDDLPPLVLGQNTPIRKVYIHEQPKIYQQQKLLEISLLYDRKIEYTIAEPSHENYGEKTFIYGLEQGLIWILEDYSHAVVCCSGLPAVRAIIRYGVDKLGFNWWLPNLTTQMFNNLKSSAQPTRATFTPLLKPHDPKITISNRFLSRTELFKSFENDSEQLQTSGFFMDSDSIIPRYGVSKKYARIWTPYKLSKLQLMALAQDFISKTETELSNEYQNSIDNYISYFRNAQINIGKYNLPNDGKDKALFLKIIGFILRALSSPNYQSTVTQDLLHGLVKQSRKLGFEIGSNFDCDNCGGGLGRCPNCLIPYRFVLQNEQSDLSAECQKCGYSFRSETYLCECGNENDIVSIENHLQFYPNNDLLNSIEEFLGLMDEVKWNHVFIINGNVIHVIEKRQLANKGQIELHELVLWQRIARIHQRHVSQQSDHIRILTMTKEKCKRNGNPPTKELCDACLRSQITIQQMKTENELCLPRILGLAIERNFDGIHHGHEIADVKYTDTLISSGERVEIGIHLKSRREPKPEGLGRSIGIIKALYMQVFYSAYQAIQNKADFDIIGLSVPNTIKKDIIFSIRELLNNVSYG